MTANIFEFPKSKATRATSGMESKRVPDPQASSTRILVLDDLMRPREASSRVWPKAEWNVPRAVPKSRLES